MTKLSAIQDVLSVAGNTPLLKLDRIVPDDSAEVWLKLEGSNPTGSYKDRMAVSVIKKALERMELQPGDRVVEYTGGSTGSALAFVSALAGVQFTAVSSNAFSESKLQAIRAYGSEVLIEESKDGNITPDLIKRMKEKAFKIAGESGCFYADQFRSPNVRTGYRPMGWEIASSLNSQLDVVCASVGTGASLMGTVDILEESGIKPEVVAIETSQSPFLTTGKGGPHQVEGIGVGFEPPFLERTRLSEIMVIDQQEAFEMCGKLARLEGLLCGGSTGINVVGALRLATRLGPKKRIITFGCDNGLKYLDGHIFNSVPVVSPPKSGPSGSMWN